jgi:hypothetical protein
MLEREIATLLDQCTLEKNLTVASTQHAARDLEIRAASHGIGGPDNSSSYSCRLEPDAVPAGGPRRSAEHCKMNADLAQRLLNRGRLAASFFFQCVYVSEPSLTWRTIAYHLASITPSIRKDVLNLLKSPGNNLLDDVEFQFEQLIEKIIKPDSFTIPLVIVLDALDESNSYEALLRTLRRWSQLQLRYKLFLTSRPEHEIQQNFADIHISRVRLLSGEAVADDTNNDIRRVLETGLSGIQQDYGIASKPWPKPMDVDEMVARAAGLFIWATTALKYIGDNQDDKFGPEHRLSEVTSGQMRTGGVDGLYLAILDRSFKTSQEGFRAVMGTILLSKEPIGISDILRLQGYCQSESAVSGVLKRLSSVLSGGTDDVITIRHQSFVDFLTNEHMWQKI